jgi:hypothetical protein
MGFIGERDVQNPERLVNASLWTQVVLHDCRKAVSNCHTMHFDARHILYHTPKSLDLQVLFDPFEE